MKQSYGTIGEKKLRSSRMSRSPIIAEAEASCAIRILEHHAAKTLSAAGTTREERLVPVPSGCIVIQRSDGLFTHQERIRCAVSDVGDARQSRPIGDYQSIAGLIK